MLEVRFNQQAYHKSKANAVYLFICLFILLYCYTLWLVDIMGLLKNCMLFILFFEKMETKFV